MINTGESNDDRFEETYRKYYARVWKYYRSCRVSDDESHDLAQDTFKRLLERWDSIRGDDPWPFLKSIAKSVLLNWIRAGQTQKRSAPLVEIDDPDLFIDPPARPEPTYEEREETARRQKLLENAFGGLSKGQRECLALWLKGSSYEDIQKILGISLDAVKSRIRDAKRYLVERLGEKS